MPTFRAPMINLYSRDLPRALGFYLQLGFVEAFRTPTSGEPVHIELTLDGFTLPTIELIRMAIPSNLLSGDIEGSRLESRPEQNMRLHLCR